MATDLVATSIPALALGTWLALAGIRKLAAIDHFESVVESVLGDSIGPRLVRGIAIVLPVLEVVIGLSVTVFLSSMALRWAVLVLCLLFVSAVLRLGARYQYFDCGCFGTGRAEHRLLIFGRTAGFAVLAAIWCTVPITVDTPTPVEMLPPVAVTWSGVVLYSIAAHAKVTAGLLRKEDTSSVN